MWIVENAVVEAFLDVVRPNVSQLVVVNRPQQMKGPFVFVANEGIDVFQGLIVLRLMEKLYQLPNGCEDEHQISQRNFNSSLGVNLARGKFDLRFNVGVFLHKSLHYSLFTPPPVPGATP